VWVGRPARRAAAGVGGLGRTVAVQSTQQLTLDEALGRVRDAYMVAERGGLLEPRDVGDASGWHGGDGLDGRAVAYLPACRPCHLGDPSFAAEHGLRYPYMGGAMANGIASVELVEALGRAGMLGVYGAAGQPMGAVESAVDRLQRASAGGDLPFGCNLIHSPGEPALEAAVADLYGRRGVTLVEASAYLDLTLPVVRYRVKGLRRDAAGAVVAGHRVIAKVSRAEVAAKFLAPPPAKFLRELVASGEVTAEQAGWAERFPMADDLTAEADSGGHTDNRPANVIVPIMIALRDRLQARHRYEQVPRVGAAGGVSTPWAAASAFAMGAAYVVTGSVNQACVESGTSDAVRAMLAGAQQADTMMAPAADMFEMGVKVQVLKRGTLFAMRAAKLYELYRAHAGLDDLAAADLATLEKTYFRAPVGEIWELTRDFFLNRDPAHVARAERDPRHKMALVFRWYLGLSSTWANAGEPTRGVDYQVWCGPAMGAFNEWVKGTFLEPPAERRVVTVGLNILYGAAVLSRARALATQGLPLPPGTPRLVPLSVAEIEGRGGR